MVEPSIKFLTVISSDVDLYLKLIKQLNKDFQIVGRMDEFSLKSNPKELIHQLQLIINNLIINHYQDFLNLLYRVDVAESQINSFDMETLSKQVVFLILKREWQKVYFRNKL